MRRGAASSTQRAADDWGRDTIRDQFWLLKLKKSALYDRSGGDELAPWRHTKERADAQSGLRASDLLELRRRIRAAGPGHLAMPDAQIHRTGKHTNDVLRGFRNIGSHRAGLIALTVEVAAGKLVTHDVIDGLPLRAEVATMTHGSGKLTRGQFGLMRAQGDVVEGLREGYAFGLTGRRSKRKKSDRLGLRIATCRLSWSRTGGAEYDGR